MPGPGARHAFELRNDLTEIERLAPELEQFATGCDLPDETLFAISLALEEIITNIIAHGYDDDGAHVIGVELGLSEEVVTATVEDDARAFNPLTATPPDVTAPLEAREVGGLGVLLVRKLMDDVTYERVGDKNLLTLKKQTAPRPSATAE